MAVSNERPPTGYTGEPATNKRMGLLRIATNAEALAGTQTKAALTPSQFAASASASFASPPVAGFGSTTARPVRATTLSVAEGANAKQGVATLAAGTVVVANTSVTATSRIFLTAQLLGTVTAPSALAVSARTPGVSFTILASQLTDTSVVAYEIFQPA